MNDDDLVLCLLTMETSFLKKKVWFMDDVKQPSEACMMCAISRETFHFFMKNMWIGVSGALCHITNNNTGLFDIIDIIKLIQGSFSIVSTMKKSTLQVNIQQVNGTEWVHTLLPMKFCHKTGAKLYSLTYKLLQGNTISSDH